MSDSKSHEDNQQKVSGPELRENYYDLMCYCRNVNCIGFYRKGCNCVRRYIRDGYDGRHSMAEFTCKYCKEENPKKIAEYKKEIAELEKRIEILKRPPPDVEQEINMIECNINKLNTAIKKLDEFEIDYKRSTLIKKRTLQQMLEDIEDE